MNNLALCARRLEPASAQKPGPGAGLVGRGRERGIASIEAAIMLPLMIIVFAGVLYVGKLVLSVQRTTSDARSCAWRVAIDGCSNVPPECPEPSRGDDPALETRLSQAGVNTSLDTDALAEEENAPDNESTNSVLADIGARLNELLLDRFETRTEDEFTKSSILGGEKVTVQKTFSLPCNSEPGSAEGLGDLLFSQFSPPTTPEPANVEDPNDP